jgi:hypothetical protein
MRRYGDLLVAVRYRYDARRGRRFTTVELVVDERPWTDYARIDSALDRIEPPESVLIQVGFHEPQLRARVRQAGGRWRPEAKAWELPFERVRALGLGGRIVFKARVERSP